jgi:hypothetical protein
VCTEIPVEVPAKQDEQDEASVEVEYLPTAQMVQVLVPDLLVPSGQVLGDTALPGEQVPPAQKLQAMSQPAEDVAGDTEFVRPRGQAVQAYESCSVASVPASELPYFPAAQSKHW